MADKSKLKSHIRRNIEFVEVPRGRYYSYWHTNTLCFVCFQGENVLRLGSNLGSSKLGNAQSIDDFVNVVYDYLYF